MSKHRITFTDSRYESVELPDKACLSEYLTVQNSPILFGCRIGICGTCLVEVVNEKDPLPQRTENEREFLEALCPDRTECRLACQIHLNTDIKIKKIEL